MPPGDQVTALLSLTGGQGVAGSNPAVPTDHSSALTTVKAEVSGFIVPW